MENYVEATRDSGVIGEDEELTETESDVESQRYSQALSEQSENVWEIIYKYRKAVI